jgi:WD40 repeat protein
VAWNPKGDLLASCGWDGQVILWDVAKCLPLAHREPGARPGALLQLSFSPDGHSLAIGGAGSTAHPWAQVLEVPTLRVLYEMAGHSKGISGLAFSHDGQYLATAAMDGMVKVWPAEPLPPYLSLEGHDQPVWAVAFCPKGDCVATGSLDQTAKIWDAKSGALLQNLNVCFPVVSLAFSHGGDRLVTVGPDSTACVWQVRPFPSPRSSRREEALAGKSAMRNPQSEIEQSLLTSAATGQEPLRLQGHTATVMAVAWSPDDRWILTASKDKSARIWDARTGALQRTLVGHRDWVLAAVFAPNSQLVATGGADDVIRLWDSRSGQCLRTLTNHQGDVLSLAFSPDGNLLASGGADRKARIWDVKSGRQLHELSASVDGVTSVAFSLNGTRLATANSGNQLYKNWNRESRIRLWDVTLGLELLSFVAHPNAVYDVAFSPDGLRFATGSGDNTARIWMAFPWRSEDYPGPPELNLSARIENYKRQFSRAAIEARRQGPNLSTEPQRPRHIGVNFAGAFNLPPAGSKASPRRPIPPRSPLAGPDQLDLTASYNVALNESWQPVERLEEVDLSLAALPSGLQTFAGVRFDVRGLIQLRRGAVDCELFPERVTAPVTRRFTRLHVLHGGRWLEQEGTPVASLVLHYAKGTEATLPIFYGKHLRAANAGQDRKAGIPLGQLVWPSPVPADPKDVQPWLYQTTFTNPRPELEVERIEYVSKVGRCGPFLVAVTVE